MSQKLSGLKCGQNYRDDVHKSAIRRENKCEHGKWGLQGNLQRWRERETSMTGSE